MWYEKTFIAQQSNKYNIEELCKEEINLTTIEKKNKNNNK